jgi:hypothetical protein
MIMYEPRCYICHDKHVEERDTTTIYTGLSVQDQGYFMILFIYITMADLGPLFASKSIKGPLVVSYASVNDRDFYFVGEDHSKNGLYRGESDVGLHVIEHLRNYNEHNRVRCYCELSTREIHSYVSDLDVEPGDTPKIYQAKSPLYAYAWCLSKQMFPVDKHDAVFCDMRKCAPYDVYSIIIDPFLFALEHHGERFYSHMPTIMKRAKSAEKTIVRHINTRAKAKNFLEAFYLADKQYPKWFVQLYKDVNETDDMPPSPLRDTMRALLERDQGMYNVVAQHMRTYYAKWDASPFTAAFERIESMRRTLSLRLVAQQNKYAMALFVELTNFLMDLYIILDIVSRPLEPGTTVVVLSGAQHTEHLARFFAMFGTVVTKSDLECDIPEGVARDGYASLVPKIPKKLANLKDGIIPSP